MKLIFGTAELDIRRFRFQAQDRSVILELNSTTAQNFEVGEILQDIQVKNGLELVFETSQASVKDYVFDRYTHVGSTAPSPTAMSVGEHRLVLSVVAQ